MIHKISIAVMLLGTISVCRAEKLELPLLWTARTNTVIESSPTIADLDGHGKIGVLVTGSDLMIALDQNGKELWRWRSSGQYAACPAVFARKGMPALIYEADNKGLMTCLDGSGKVIWQTHLTTGSSWSSSVVCDLNHDGHYSVIQTDDSGVIWDFDALTGKELWKTSMKGLPVSPAVADIDGDGKEEIAIASNSGLLALFSSTGALKWERTVSGVSGNWETSAPVIFAASNGSRRILVGASDGYVRCFDNIGNLLWTRKTNGSVASSISVGDMDQDGIADVFAITQTGYIYRFNQDGRPIWNIDMQGRTLAAGALIDLENNGHLDFVTSTQSGHLMVFNDHGEIIFQRQFPNRTINMTPTFGALTPNSSGLDMVITGGESGRVFCFSSPAAKDASLCERPWISYRGDNFMTAAWFGIKHAAAASMTPDDASLGRLLAGIPIVFKIKALTRANLPLKASAICIRPDGSIQSATTPIYGRKGVLPLHIDILKPGNYRFRWDVEDSKGQRLADGQRSVFLEPFANDHALIDRTLSSLALVGRSVAHTLPLSESALRLKEAVLEIAARKLQLLQKQLAGADSDIQQAALRQTAALDKQALRDAGLARAVEGARALGSNTSLIAFETTLWDSKGIDKQLPTQEVNPLKIARRVLPGMHDPVSIKLLNITNRPLQVRVVIEIAPGGPVVTPFRSIAVPTSQGGMAWDPLTELDNTSVITIPSLSASEVWLDSEFDRVKPGNYKVTIRFQALNGSGVLEGSVSNQDVPAPETDVEVNYQALPFALAPSGSFHLCCWAVYGPAVIKDLLNHGNNVFVVPQGDAIYNAQDRLTGFDYSKLDVILTALRGHDVVALVNGMPTLKPSPGSPQHTADFKTYLTDLVSHMAKMGFNTNHFALYPFDEAGGAGWYAVNQVAEFGKEVKAVNPNVKLYQDGGGELGMFQKLAPYINIWSPSIIMLPDHSPEMGVIRATHQQLWSYDCAYGYTTAMGANLKDTNIVAEYRTAALFAYRWGATGIGFWSYNIGADSWERVANDYPLVYSGRTKPVTSRRWEAVRQGIEDCRIIIALQKCETTVKDPALKMRMERLLNVTLPTFTDRSYNEMTAGLGRSAFSESKNDFTLAAFRKKMLNCVEAACSESGKR